MNAVYHCSVHLFKTSATNAIQAALEIESSVNFVDVKVYESIVVVSYERSRDQERINKRMTEVEVILRRYNINFKHKILDF